MGAAQATISICPVRDHGLGHLLKLPQYPRPWPQLLPLSHMQVHARASALGARELAQSNRQAKWWEYALAFAAYQGGQRLPKGLRLGLPASLGVEVVLVGNARTRAI